MESKTDARLYERLYQSYKEHLSSERSLIFIEVGNTGASGGESNAGCAQVDRLVKNLRDGGNVSVFGLTDWDGSRRSTSRVHVLSPEIRDGLESVLLDPVLLCAAAIRENMPFCRDKAIIESEERYTDLGGWSGEKWQNIVDRLQAYVLDRDVKNDQRITIQYLNNMSLNISKSYLHLDDHALEERVLDKFGFFRPRNNNSGDLMKYIVSTVLNDYPLLVPLDLLESFGSLLESDS
ncbi:hypothetical protein RM531_13325 [Salinisphaera sp. P385]|uniref:Uncharacterized protein n=1 Tax=Spectribacter acetivorans TaxID=3075603 RepID=A0ABU3BDL8_9GAMM|nr:hypothetical protein [Salinisphaera sp. P385]MDT0619453.1 hypothetical protein [Salinisphaera sp. P385]